MNTKKLKTILTFIIMCVFCPANIAGQTTTLQIWMDENVKVVADGETVNWIRFYEYDENAMSAYCAFNFETILPAGLSVAKITNNKGRLVDAIRLTDRKGESHNISCGLTALAGDENHQRLRISCISSDSEPFSDICPEDGSYAICEIGLVADPSMEVGEYDVWMNNGKFIYEDANYATKLSGEFFRTKINVVKPMTIDYTMSSAGVGTLIVPFDCEVPTGLTVSTCPSVDANNYVVQEAAASIKAYTPYLVEGIPGTYTLTGNAGAVDETQTYREGVLVGVLQKTKPPVGSYVLQNQNGHVAFFFYGEENTSMLSPYRCYLSQPTLPANIRAVYIDMPTGIRGVAADAKVDVYSTDGQLVRSRVQAADALDGLAAGIYIVNGKKYIKTK